MFTFKYEDMYKTNFGEVIYDIFFAENGPTRKHIHNYYEIFLVTKGEIWQNFNGTDMCLSSGDLFFLRPSDCHYMFKKDFNKKAGWINMNLRIDYIEEMLSRYSDINDPCNIQNKITLSSSQYHTLIEKFDFILDDSYETPSIQKAIFDLLIGELLVLFLTNNYKTPKSEIPPWLTNAINKFESDDFLTNDVNYLVELTGKSHEHVTRLFKKYMFMNPTTYINNLRLKHAANLLTYTQKPIIEITYECGFNSSSYFNKIFKERYHVSPSVYRQNHTYII